MKNCRIYSDERRYYGEVYEVKKFLCLFMTSVLVMLNGCSKEGISKIAIVPLAEQEQDFAPAWRETNFEASLKQYSVKGDLSNVSNSSDIPELDIIDRYLLSRNLFIIKKPDCIFEQPFSIYQRNAAEGISNFITADSMLHTYHIICDYIVRSMEEERLVNELRAFTQGSFRRSMEIYRGTREPFAKNAALKNIAYFGIAMKLLGFDLPGGIPLEANRIIDNDVKKVKSRWSSGKSEIFPYSIDYKKYIATGHYYRDTDSKNYFLTMMWYGNTPMQFESYDNNSGEHSILKEQIAMAVIMVSGILGDENLRKLWDDIYRISTVYSGKAGDMTVYDLSDIIKTVYGEKIDINKIWNEDKLKKVHELAVQRYNMRLKQTMAGKISLLDKENIKLTQFRLMGQMYNLDHDIYNSFIGVDSSSFEDGGQHTKGLYIPSAFGNDSANDILVKQHDGDMVWEKCHDKIEDLRTVLSGNNGDNPEEYSLNSSLFWVLRGYTVPSGSGYPSFMMGEGWKHKKLLTYISSVSDARHATYLTGKQGSTKEAESGHSLKCDMPGYVEPDVGLYSRLEYMGSFLTEFLSANNFTNARLYTTLDNFTGLAAFLKRISIKELNNEPLVKEEEDRLKSYGEELKKLMLNAVKGKGDIRDWDTIPRVDRNMAAVTDAYLYENQILQTAIGPPDYIYVVVPYKDKLYLTRGSVNTYYEFVQPLSRKFDDSDWQDTVRNNKEPEQQEWIQRIRLD